MAKLEIFPSLTWRIVTASLKSQGLVVYQAEKWHDMTGVGPTEVRSDRQPRSPRHSSEVIRGRWEEPGVNSLHELRNHQESIFLPHISSESNTKLLAHIKYSIFSISFCFGSQLKKKFPFHTLCEGCFFFIFYEETGMFSSGFCWYFKLLLLACVCPAIIKEGCK